MGKEAKLVGEQMEKFAKHIFKGQLDKARKIIYSRPIIRTDQISHERWKRYAEKAGGLDEGDLHIANREDL